MIIVIGNVTAKSGCEAQVLASSLEHVARSRSEDGCIDHRVAVDQENGIQFRFVEYWADQDALKAHFAVPASREFVAGLIPLLAEPPEMQIFDARKIDI